MTFSGGSEAVTVVSLRRRLNQSRAQRRRLEQRIHTLEQRVEDVTNIAAVNSARIDQAAAELMLMRQRVARAGH
jgi:chromosome segregation ATPase